MGCRLIGKTAASDTANEGSIPSTSTKYKLFENSIVINVCGCISHHPQVLPLVAQPVERFAEDEEVMGSIPI